MSTHLHKRYYSQQDQMYLGNLGNGIFSFQFSGSSHFFLDFFCFVLFWCSSRIHQHDQKRSHEIKKKVTKLCLPHDSRKYAFWVLNLVLFLIPRRSNRLTSHLSGFFKVSINVLFTNYMIQLNLKSKRLY